VVVYPDNLFALVVSATLGDKTSCWRSAFSGGYVGQNSLAYTGYRVISNCCTYQYRGAGLPAHVVVKDV